LKILSGDIVEEGWKDFQSSSIILLPASYSTNGPRSCWSSPQNRKGT